jgi:hypothetical protein
MWQHMQYAHQLIRPAALADTYRTLDYNYSVSDFDNSLTQNNLDAHTPWGIRPFFERRYISTLNQIEPFVTSTHATPAQPFSVYPNPTSSSLTVHSPENASMQLDLFHFSGQQIMHSEEGQSTLRVDMLPSGMYFLRISTSGAVVQLPVVITGFY